MDAKGIVVAVVGADGRQRAAARALAAAGCRVGGGELARQAGCLLLPLPVDAAWPGLAGLLAAARPGTLVLAGRPPAEVGRMAAAAGLRLVDYAAREDFAVRNAVPTAEGCIELLLRRRPRTLWGSPVLVTGYGRVGQALAARLAALGAKVTVAARKAAQRAAAETQGMDAVRLTDLAAEAGRFDTVVNTIPAPVVTGPVLAALPRGSLLVELASAPGGIDLAEAAALGHTALTAPGLPARCAPESAGAILARTALEILREEDLA